MYKNLTALTLVLMLGVSGMALAKHDHRQAYADGGFDGGTAQVVPVKEALTMPDDSTVVLNGRIEKRLSKNKYLFQDESGTGIVKINDDVFDGQTVTPSDTVRLQGKVDQDDDASKTKIKVKRLSVQTKS